MIDNSTSHGTVVVERTIDAPVARVYAAFADPKARASWGTPSDTVIFIYDETDFRVGGRDVARCGDREDPRYRVEARYIDIVDKRRVVWTEIIHELHERLAANITTLELVPEGQRTRLKVTVQVTSFVGVGMIENTNAGYTSTLANMARYLEQSKPAI
ncbi:MAG: SRPBCC family protein [Kiloniellales bacterium]